MSDFGGMMMMLSLSFFFLFLRSFLPSLTTPTKLHTRTATWTIHPLTGPQQTNRVGMILGGRMRDIEKKKACFWLPPNVMVWTEEHSKERSSSKRVHFTPLQYGRHSRCKAKISEAWHLIPVTGASTKHSPRV